MQRLSGLDTSFLSMETPTAYMHVAGLLILDPSTVPGGFDYQKVHDFYASRLHLAAPFRRRLSTIPLGLHQPLWIEDPDFDLERHLHHIAVPSPGGPKELAKLVARVNAIQLDRSRPLWEAWIIEGLEDGHVAVLTKVHHSAMDGVSGNEITVAMLQLAPGEAAPEPAEEWTPEHDPSNVEKLGFAALSLARQPWVVAKAVRRTIESSNARKAVATRLGDIVTPSAFSAPRTSFNAALTPQRTFAFTSVSLAEVKQVKNALGVTVNDVVLALCGGALRRYLDARGEHPEGPLVAMVPVSVRPDELKGAAGNQVSNMFCSLATDLDDPVERIAAINQGTQQAKELHAVGADALQDWAEFAAPGVAGLAARLYSRGRFASRHRPLFNLTISNVPGPPFPLWSADARLLAHYPMGPIFDGSGLNITVMSYLDHLDFGVVACSDLIPDAWELAEGLQDALDELAKAAGV